MTMWLRPTAMYGICPKSQLGIDVEHDFRTQIYHDPRKGRHSGEPAQGSKKADKVYLATDPDREGEAISWHLMKALKLEDKKACRITFNEITKTAVKASFKSTAGN